MSKKATSKYSVVGSSALYDLAAELEAQKEKLHQQAGSSTSIKGLKREPKVCVAVPVGGKSSQPEHAGLPSGLRTRS
jgi:hypothetical protein